MFSFNSVGPRLWGEGEPGEAQLVVAYLPPKILFNRDFFLAGADVFGAGAGAAKVPFAISSGRTFAGATFFGAAAFLAGAAFFLAGAAFLAAAFFATGLFIVLFSPCLDWLLGSSATEG
jgi:hypothetical protein